MTGYNPLNSMNINLESCGICEVCGHRFSNPQCTHATPEQIALAQAIDEQADSEDIFGNTIVYKSLKEELKTDGAWLSSRSFVRQPFNDHSEESLPVGERVAMTQGTSALPHDAETRPTYDQLINGAKFTDEHRAELHKWWNEKYK